MLATNPIDKDILDRAMSIIEQHLDDTEFNVNVFTREMAMARTNFVHQTEGHYRTNPKRIYTDYPFEERCF